VGSLCRQWWLAVSGLRAWRHLWFFACLMCAAAKLVWASQRSQFRSSTHPACKEPRLCLHAPSATPEQPNASCMRKLVIQPGLLTHAMIVVWGGRGVLCGQWPAVSGLYVHGHLLLTACLGVCFKELQQVTVGFSEAHIRHAQNRRCACMRTQAATELTSPLLPLFDA
jgi:hypothetical protein